MQNETLTQIIDFSHETLPGDVNINPVKLRLLVNLYEKQVVEYKLHPSAQMVLLRHGKVILNRAVGTSRGKPVINSTPYLTFSVSKAFTGACIHKLIEEGKISLDARVADYWPEFGCKGKETATIRQVFLHLAGIPAPKLYSQVFTWPVWPWVTHHVANSQAVYRPGEVIAYHMLNYGFILGEVLRRVTGQSIGKYLHDNFLEPLGMKNSYMPLPLSQFFNSPKLETNENSLNTAVFLFNLPFNRAALMPAATLHSCAKDIAIFYQMLINGGIYAGKQYLKPETVAFATSEGSAGFDHALKTYQRWGYGFHLGGKIQTPEGEKSLGMGSGASQRAYGHFGMASSIAMADPDADIVFAFTCSRLIDSGKVRNRPLLDALWNAIE